MDAYKRRSIAAILLLKNLLKKRKKNCMFDRSLKKGELLEILQMVEQ